MIALHLLQFGVDPPAHAAALQPAYSPRDFRWIPEGSLLPPGANIPSLPGAFAAANHICRLHKTFCAIRDHACSGRRTHDAAQPGALATEAQPAGGPSRHHTAARQPGTTFK